jgi:putative IMPACT (imprinted ancient) family translation regulator
MDHLVRSSDDKEPSGTAGGPILNVLLKNHLNHVLLVVVRYFGGVLLGASNLTRAYSNTALEVLSNASLIPYIEYETYILNFSYDNMKDIDYLLRDCVIEKKEFNEIVSYTVLIDKKSDILTKIGHMAQIKKAN